MVQCMQKGGITRGVVVKRSGSRVKVADEVTGNVTGWVEVRDLLSDEQMRLKAQAMAMKPAEPTRAASRGDGLFGMVRSDRSQGSNSQRSDVPRIATGPESSVQQTAAQRREALEAAAHGGSARAMAKLAALTASQEAGGALPPSTASPAPMPTEEPGQEVEVSQANKPVSQHL